MALHFKTIADIERRVSQGHGSGEGGNYSPWLAVRDVPSKGRSHRPYGIKTGREHHLLSDLEYKVFICQEFCSSVVDLREQYPLLPYGLTGEIARAANITHPRCRGTKLDWILTTDLVVTVNVGPTSNDQVQVALSVKYVKDLEDLRTLEKLEIERRFWAYHGVQWYLVTDRSIPPYLFENIEWLRHGAVLDPSLNDQELHERFLTNTFRSPRIGQTLKDRLARIAAEAALPFEYVLIMFKHFAWHQVIDVRLTDRPLDLQTWWNDCQGFDIHWKRFKGVARDAASC